MQKTKLAAIEAEWETQPAPASFNLFAIPDQQTESNRYAIEVPYLLGLIATRSLDQQVIGLKDLMKENEGRIRNGMKSYQLLQELRTGNTDPAVRDAFNRSKQDLGYGLLLKRYTDNPAQASDAQITKAAKDSIPEVAPLYFAFRIMVGCGVLMTLLITASFYSVVRGRIGESAGCCAPRCWGYHCRGLPVRQAGLWPSMAVSRGRSTIYCRRRLPTRR